MSKLNQVSITFYKNNKDCMAKKNGKTYKGKTVSDCYTKANSKIVPKIDGFYAWFGSGDSRYAMTGCWD